MLNLSTPRHPATSSCPQTLCEEWQTKHPGAFGMVSLKNGVKGVGVAKSLSLTVGKECGLPGTQRFVELLNESQVVKVRENVHHSVIFQ